MLVSLENKTIESRVMEILERITETDQVWQDLGLELFDQHLLDSLGMVEVIVALSDEFGIEISPAEVERDQWASPRKIIAQIKTRLEKGSYNQSCPGMWL